MKILIVSQYFWPETFPINDFAKGLKERGHQVTVLTGLPNYPGGRVFSGYGVFRRTREKYNGIDVIRVPLIPRGNGRHLALTLNYLSFAFIAFTMAPFVCRGKYDAIFVYQPSPVTVCLPALVLKMIKKIPVVLWVQDLWPESLSATGMIKSPFLLRVVGRLVSFIYKRCNRILIQSRAFGSSITRMGVTTDKISYFPNSGGAIRDAEEAVMPDVTDIPEGFRIMFAGNIGASQDFETILSAAKRLQCHEDIHWLIVGDGRRFSHVKEQIHKLGLEKNMHMLGKYSPEEMPYFFKSADVLLATLKKDSAFSLTIPSKIQAYLAYGKPIIAALDGEGARVVEEASAGVACCAGDPGDLADAVMSMYNQPKERREVMGRSGRDYYKANFDREVLLDQFEAMMAEV